MAAVYIAIMVVLLAAILAARKLGNKKAARALSAAALLGICICGYLYFRAADGGSRDYRQTAMSYYTSQGNAAGELLKEHKVRRIALLAEEGGEEEEQLRQLADALRNASGAEVTVPKLAAAAGARDFTARLSPKNLGETVTEQYDAVIFTFNCPAETYYASALARRTKEKTLRSIFLNYFDPGAARKLIDEGALTAATIRKAADPDARPANNPQALFDTAYELLK
ncbi:MAG: hypothetical protein HPZ91_13220 [Lentisphaeria bacterium]|nr:hypothetical protein [Lentisphaeria bacterium]